MIQFALIISTAYICDDSSVSKDVARKLEIVSSDENFQPGKKATSIKKIPDKLLRGKKPGLAISSNSKVKGQKTATIYIPKNSVFQPTTSRNEQALKDIARKNGMRVAAVDVNGKRGIQLGNSEGSPINENVPIASAPLSDAILGIIDWMNNGNPAPYSVTTFEPSKYEGITPSEEKQLEEFKEYVSLPRSQQDFASVVVENDDPSRQLIGLVNDATVVEVPCIVKVPAGFTRLRVGVIEKNGQAPTSVLQDSNIFHCFVGPRQLGKISLRPSTIDQQSRIFWNVSNEDRPTWIETRLPVRGDSAQTKDRGKIVRIYKMSKEGKASFLVSIPAGMVALWELRVNGVLFGGSAADNELEVRRTINVRKGDEVIFTFTGVNPGLGLKNYATFAFGVDIGDTSPFDVFGG